MQSNQNYTVWLLLPGRSPEKAEKITIPSDDTVSDLGAEIVKKYPSCLKDTTGIKSLVLDLQKSRVPLDNYREILSNIPGINGGTVVIELQEQTTVFFAIKEETDYFNSLGTGTTLCHAKNDLKFYTLKYPVYNPFFGDKKQSALLLRSSYLKIFSKMEEEISLRNTRFLILGNPGIGKSCFLFYLMEVLIRFQLAKTIVLYRKSDLGRIYCYSDRQLRTVSLSDPYLAIYLSHPKTWYLVDSIPDPGKVNAITVNVASTRLDNYREFKKYPNVVTFYMPVWNLLEIDIAATQCFDPPLSLHTVSERFADFGGIPRTLFSVDDVSQLLDTAIARTNLQVCIDSVLEPDMPNSVSSHIVHLIPDSTYRKTTAHFASNKIGDTIISKFIKISAGHLSQWLQSSAGETEFGVLRGTIFESFAHRKLVTGGQFEFRNLSNGEKHTEDVPNCSNQLFVDRFGDKLAEKTYYRPYSKTHGAIDSWKWEFGVIQITIRDTHPMKIDLIGPILQTIPSGMLKRIVFVVPPERFELFKKQNLVKNAEEVCADKQKERTKKRKLLSNEQKEEKQRKQSASSVLLKKLQYWESIFKDTPQYVMKMPYSLE